MCLDVVLFIKSIYIEKAKKDLLFFKKNLILLFFRYINISQECLIDKKNKLKIKKNSMYLFKQLSMYTENKEDW